MILIPSRIDNYPNTCLEAQALGKIVVGTRDSSLDEMVEDGVTGFLAEPGDSESLASAILRGLALSAEERKQMAERIQLLEKQRDPEECLQRLERFYRSVAHAGPGYWRNSEV